ncbi:MAG: hypothetical protein EAX96_14540 [Candidatus Lokiarchaeota archaeon]|nr:hypothetical protein [Candidatus Lokiarchaeota archaeon]
MNSYMENVIEGSFPIWQFHFSDYKITDLYFKTNKITKFILGKQQSDGGFGDIERTFWAIFALKNLNKVQLLDKEKVENYILRHRAPIGGFFNIIKQPDIWTTFYAIFALKLLNIEINEDEKSLHLRFIKSIINADGFFSHCKSPDCICGGQVSLKSTFFALFSIYLLDSLEIMELFLRNTKYLAKKISKQKIDNIYLLLCRKILNLDIDDGWGVVLSKFQKNDGGFGQKEFGTIFETFWMVSFLKTNNWLNKINRGKLFDFLKTLHKKDGGFNDKLVGVPSDLITTSQAISSLIMLTPDLIDFIENEVLKQVAIIKEVYLKSITEEFFINELLILNVVKSMMATYEWFDVDLIKFRNVFSSYLKNLKEDEQRIAKKLMIQIRNKNETWIDLSNFAKTFRKIKDKEKMVKDVVSNLIKHRFIIGSIEFSRKLLKKSLILNVYFVPDDLIIKKKDYPLDVVLAEKEEFKADNERVKQITQLAQGIPNEFGIGIMTLLDSDEVELAREKLNKNFENQTNLLESLNVEVKGITNKYNYFDFSKHISVKAWMAVEKEVLKRLNIERSELDKQIKSKEKIIQAYDELENLVNYINENLTNFDKSIQDIILNFNDTCLKERIDQQQTEILNNIDKLENNIQSIADKVKVKAAEIAQYSKNVNALKNIIITEEAGISKRIITQVKESLEPFEYWLENQWNRKRQSTRERLMDIKSKIFRRNDLLKEIENKKKEIEQKIESLTDSTDDEELDNKVSKILELISSTGQFIENYILDTNKLLDGFANIVALDIPRKWSEQVEEIYSKLNDKREEVKKKLFDAKELEQKDILGALIEKDMITISEMMKQLDYLETIDYSASNTSLNDLINEKKDEITSIRKSKTDDIKKFIKNNLKKFSNFHITTNILINKWETFLQGIDTLFFQRREKLIESVLISLLDTLSEPETGGRVDINQLSQLIGIKRYEIKEKIEKLMVYSKIEAIFDEKEEKIIPLNMENKKQLEYEEKIKKILEDTEKEHVVNFFRKVCEKKLLKDNLNEIHAKINKVYKKLENYEIYLGQNYKPEINNPYNSFLMEKWEEKKNEIYVDLSQISSLLDARKEFGELIANSLTKIKEEVENINNFILNQIREKVSISEDLNLKLDAHVTNYKKLLDEQKRNQMQFIKTHEANFHNFNRIVIDLNKHFEKELSKIEKIFLKNKEKLEEKINTFQTELLKEDLRQKIINNKEEFQKLLEQFDEIKSDIEHGRLEEANSLLNTKFIAISKDLRRLNDDIKRFIDESEKKYNLINLKDSCRVILRDWDSEQMVDSLKKINTTIENQLILKHIEFAEKAYSTSKIKLNLIASKMNMKTSKLKERLYHILGIANISNVKLTPYKNEIIFTDRQMAELKQIELEKIISEDDKIKEEFKEINSLQDAFRRIFKIIAPILGAVGALLTIAIAIQPIIGTHLAIGIPTMVFIIIVIAVFVYYKKFSKIIDDD